MKHYFFILFFIISILVWSSCSKKVYYSKQAKHWKDSLQPDSSLLDHTVYLIGDAGDPELTREEPTFKILREQIEKDSNSSLVFLGDNIYNHGLPSKEAEDRKKSEEKMDAQLNIVSRYKGKSFFISGNHDWDYMRAGGLQAVRRQEDYIEQKLGQGNTFVPNNGCPGPFRTLLTKDLVLVALDSQWWLHDHSKPYGSASDCESEDESDVVAQLEDIIQSHKNKNVLVVAHHPLYSNGNHGGYYSLMDYIFPLRLINKYLYIPLPFLGSLYPLHRKFGGTAQDIVHYRYQRYKQAVLKATSLHKNLIYAAGHDHNLQYQEADSLYHIVSGAGSKLSPVRMRNGATFVKHSKGFSKLKYYKNKQVWIEFWTPDEKGNPELSFSYKVYEKKNNIPDIACGLSNVNYKDSSIVVTASRKYRRTQVGRLLLGEHYRDEWITPVKVPIIDLKTEHGGLLPYGKGGGKQSLSLKLKDTADHEFTLRSVRKDPTKAVPVELRNTFLHDLVKDQISAQHPYGALIIPPLAKAANVLHTNPRLFIIPNDSCLGPYREEFKNMLAIFEEDPDENHENIASMGNPANIVGTEKVIAEIEDNNKHKIDDKLLVRTRLFDMLIGDWDRHERQYRWAERKSKDGKLFQPIPEDRDQVFFNFDGLIPYIVSRKWAIRNLKNFDHEYEDLAGLNQSAKKIDRRFLSGVTEKEWIEIADSLKNSLSNATIKNAVLLWPEEIRTLHGAEIVEKLKARRDKLPEAAREYYKILNKYVDVFGSQKSEKITIQRLDDSRVHVVIHDLTKEKELGDTLFTRIFERAVTKEIRVYALGGNDEIEVTGNTKKSILVRIIGSREADKITDLSHVKGIRKKTIVYDSKEGNSIVSSSETNEELSADSDIHEPSKDIFQYNSLSPQLCMNYNRDDGIFLGGGILYKKYKFRKSPYAAQHRLVFSIATFTGSKIIEYTNDIKGVLPGLDLNTNIRAFTPAYVMNFFGYGNESKFNLEEKGIEYFRVLLNQYSINPSINHNITRFFKVGIGPKYEAFKLEEKENTFIYEFSDSSLARKYNHQHYLGVRGFFSIGAVDNNLNPTRGIMLKMESNFYKKLNGEKSTYSQTLSEFIFYITPNLPFQLTFAGRIGGGFNTGKYAFYQANMLGAGNMLGVSQNLRGYRKTRFIGDQSFYQNAEIRLQLLKFNLYLFPGKFGVLGLFDNGRVWARGENSNHWHSAYGPGLWLNIFNKIIVTGTYTISEEEKLFNFRLGYSF